jgi:hypothetical protein
VCPLRWSQNHFSQYLLLLHHNVVAEPVADFPIPMAATPIVGSPMIEVDEDLEPVFQEPIINHEEEQQEPRCASQ